MNAKGYTLVELLAVLTILVMIVGLSGYFVMRKPFALSLKSSVLELAQCLRRAQVQAISKNEQTVVVLDLDQRRFKCPSASGTFPPQSRVLIRTIASDFVREHAATLRFFADGTSSGGSIFIESQGQIWAVHLNWLMGDVRVEQAQAWPLPQG